MSRPVARYRQLKEHIIARIANGELAPRDRVPSENELAATFKVSRMTANRALRELYDEGYVERVAGAGTFVADLRAASHLLEVRNISDEIAARGHRHAAVELEKSRHGAGDDIAQALQLEPGSDVLYALIVHCENELPLQLEERYVSAAFAPDFLEHDFERVTPSACLSAIAPLQEAEQVVRAAMPTATRRRQLAMRGGEPCLVVARRTWAHGHPVSIAYLYHPGSRFELSGHYTPAGMTRSRPRDLHGIGCRLFREHGS